MARRKSTRSSNHSDIEIFLTEDGVQVRILKNPKLPMLVSRAMSSVDVPKRPTYEVKTFSGRVEVFPLDEKSAEQTEGGTERWNLYQQELKDAETERNLRVLRAIFGLGIDLDLPEDDEWIMDLEIAGIPLPSSEREMKLEYMMTQLSVTDMNNIIKKVMN